MINRGNRPQRRWNLRQSLLTVSSEGKLCFSFLRQALVESDICPAECFICKLPDELLAHILGFLAPPPRAYNEDEYKQRVGCSTVCKRWRRIFEPLMYHCPDFGLKWEELPRRNRMLLRTLRERPDLPNFVRRLTIVPRALSRDNDIYVEILERCKQSLREIILYTLREDEYFWIIVRSLKDCAHLLSLSISGRCGGCVLDIVLDNLNIPTLRNLSLSRYGSSFRAPWENSNGISLGATTSHLESQLADRSGHSAITALKLHDPSVGWYQSYLFAQWPS